MRGADRGVWVVAWLTLLHTVGGPGIAAGQPGGKQSRIDEIVRLNQEKGRLYSEGKFREAIPLAERALELAKGVFGEDSGEAATGLSDLALLHEELGDVGRATDMHERALAIRERRYGPESLPVAQSLNNFGLLVKNSGGDLMRAAPMILRALAIKEKLLPPDSTSLATGLANVGQMFADNGDYARAVPYIERAVAIHERSGADPVGHASTVSNLAGVRGNQGSYAEAERLYEQARALAGRQGDSGRLLLALIDNNFALLLGRLGAHDRALELMQRALLAHQDALGADAVRTASVRGNLASIEHGARLYDRAERSYREALAVLEKRLGPEHPTVANMRNNLGLLQQERGRLGDAEASYQAALAILTRRFGDDHLETAVIHHNLGALAERTGRPDEALALLGRALRIREKGLGPDHPLVAVTLSAIAAVHQRRGAIEQALSSRARALATSDATLKSTLVVGGDQRKRDLMASIAAETHATVSLHAVSAPRNPRALHLALTTILRRKARSVDALADTLGRLRRRAASADLSAIDELALVRGQIAALSLADSGVGGRAQALDAARRREAELEDDLAMRGLEGAPEALQVTIDEVAAALPADAALIEMIRYRPLRTEVDGSDGFGDARYAAYVLRRGQPPRFADLGDARELDRLISDARREIAGTPDPSASLRALDRVLLEPALTLTAGARDLFVAPDGAANLVPFAALVDRHGNYRVAEFRFTYLTSGRDLLRRAHAAARSRAVVIADPDFGAAGSQRGGLQFDPLPATATEGHAIARIMGADLRVGARATESAMRSLRGPEILHVATHGFFLGEGVSQSRSTRAFKLLHARGSPSSSLVRAGLALHGANLGADIDGKDDGILTALELAGLDLAGTRLVTLSACDTGVGDVVAGDGVHGLRRALAIAGAQTQVMSLWKVDDRVTAELMEAYYRRLRRGDGRSDALREVQLAMLADGARPHPRLWAAFIAVGDGTSLTGTPPPPVRQAPRSIHAGVRPRGCGCGGGGATGGAPLALLAIAISLRRSRPVRGRSPAARPGRRGC